MKFGVLIAAVAVLTLSTPAQSQQLFMNVRNQNPRQFDFSEDSHFHQQNMSQARIQPKYKIVSQDSNSFPFKNMEIDQDKRSHQRPDYEQQPHVNNMGRPLRKFEHFGGQQFQQSNFKLKMRPQQKKQKRQNTNPMIVQIFNLGNGKRDDQERNFSDYLNKPRNDWRDRSDDRKLGFQKVESGYQKYPRRNFNFQKHDDYKEKKEINRKMDEPQFFYRDSGRFQPKNIQFWKGNQYNFDRPQKSSEKRSKSLILNNFNRRIDTQDHENFGLNFEKPESFVKSHKKNQDIFRNEFLKNEEKQPFPAQSLQSFQMKPKITTIPFDQSFKNSMNMDIKYPTQSQFQSNQLNFGNQISGSQMRVNNSQKERSQGQPSIINQSQLQMRQLGFPVQFNQSPRLEQFGQKNPQSNFFNIQNQTPIRKVKVKPEISQSFGNNVWQMDQKGFGMGNNSLLRGPNQN